MRDCVGIMGLVITVAGLGMISRPLAIIVTGVVLVLCALFAPQPKKKTGG